MRISELAKIVEARYGDPRKFMVNVSTWLQQYDITQASLAEEAGTDPANLNRWINGHISPSLKNMLLLDEALERLIPNPEEVS